MQKNLLIYSRPAIIVDTMERVKDSLVILISWIRIYRYEIFSGRNITKQFIDTCMIKKSDWQPYKLGSTICRYSNGLLYQTYSNIEQNQIFFEDEFTRKLEEAKSVSVVALLSEFQAI